MRAMRSLVFALLLGAGVSGQEAPVTVKLRLENERSSFKIGEPIRLELVFTAATPGYMVEVGGMDDAVERMTISPEAAVRRLRPVTGRHTYQYIGDITQTRNIFPISANYWALFDRPGTYTISLETRRAARSRSGRMPDEPALVLKTNAVSFTIEPTTPEDEQRLISAADQSMRASLTLGARDHIRAAEMLSFLPSDAAAVVKYRWHKELATTKDLPFNAYHLVKRGFQMTRNPAAILAVMEADLSNLEEPVMWDMIDDAAGIAMAVNSTPYVFEQAKYVDLVHQSLAHRTGLSKIQSAAALVWGLADRAPRDVIRLVIDGFAQLPSFTRLLIADVRWAVIRDASLAPTLRRTLDEVEAYSRVSLFRALIDIAPELAVEPLAADILDAKRVVTADLVEKMPPGSMNHVAAPLLATIRKGLDGSKPDLAGMKWKISVLAVVADGTFRNDIRDLYDRYGELDSFARDRLLHYLLQWAPDEGKARLAETLAQTGDRRTLYALADFKPVPALSSVLRHDLFDPDLERASGAVYLLSKHATADDIAAIEQRLTQWRIDAHRRRGSAEALTKTDEEFESMAVSVLAGAKPKLSSEDRAQLSAACLTEACRTALKER